MATKTEISEVDESLRYSEFLLLKRHDFKRVCSRCAAIWENHQTSMTFQQKKRILRQHAVAAFYMQWYELSITKGNQYLGMCPADAQLRWYVMTSHLCRAMQLGAGFTDPVTPPHLRPVLAHFSHQWHQFVVQSSPKPLLHIRVPQPVSSNSNSTTKN